MNKILDPGHKYELLVLDQSETVGDFSGHFTQTLTFVKRCDLNNPDRFPGNTDAYPGTTVQSVLRCLLERMRYLQNQKWCLENVFVIQCLRFANYLMEYRAARRHELKYHLSIKRAETAPLCPKCGHTVCHHG